MLNTTALKTIQLDDSGNNWEMYSNWTYSTDHETKGEAK